MRNPTIGFPDPNTATTAVNVREDRATRLASGVKFMDARHYRAIPTMPRRRGACRVCGQAGSVRPCLLEGHGEPIEITMPFPEPYTVTVPERYVPSWRCAEGCAA